jgi:hypothetical protein
MENSKSARARAMQCIEWANVATDTGVRSALLDVAAGFMKLAGELERSKALIDGAVIEMLSTELPADAAE